MPNLTDKYTSKETKKGIKGTNPKSMKTKSVKRFIRTEYFKPSKNRNKSFGFKGELWIFFHSYSIQLRNK